MHTQGCDAVSDELMAALPVTLYERLETLNLCNTDITDTVRTGFRGNAMH